jgi:hypothetical protein
MPAKKTDKTLDAHEIWETMNKASLQADGHKSEINKRDYIPWAPLAEILYSRFPEATVEWTRWEGLDACIYPDGTASVECSVTIGPVTRTIALPIRQGNVAKKNWDAMDVNTAKMRCFAKAVALHGLALHLFTGEDLSDIEEMEKPAPPPAKKAAPKANGKLTPEEWARVGKITRERAIELGLKPSEVKTIGLGALKNLGYNASEDLPASKLEVLVAEIKKFEPNTGEVPF